MQKSELHELKKLLRHDYRLLRTSELLYMNKLIFKAMLKCPIKPNLLLCYIVDKVTLELYRQRT